MGKEEIIVRELRQAKDGLWIRELARRCGMHPYTVSYYLKKKLTEAVDIEMRELTGQRYLVFVKLKAQSP